MGKLAGYAFEIICLKHTNEIRKALNLQNVGCLFGSWKFLPSKGSQQDFGAQIDLLFDRDNAGIALVEIKYSEQKLQVDK